jgi:DNA primase catalytic core
MARIPEHEIERLKTDISLIALAEARGITLKRSGDNLLGLCPFHDDHEPSLVISPSKNLWHCLGACQAGGTVIDWVMRANGVSFRHAVELLRSDLSLAAGSGGPVKLSKVRKLPLPVVLDADDQALLNQTIDFYHQSLLESPEALAYLDKRGLRHPEAAQRFKLGFVNRTLGYRLPAANVKAGAELRGRLQQIGILRETGHEHFRGYLVIPVFDPQGNVTEVYGRRIDHHGRSGQSPHLYLPGPHRGVWNVQALQQHPEIILCEALIDALTFWCAGFTNVTAAYGVEGFTEDHLAVFKRCGTQRILIGYDRDEAGNKAAEKLAEKLIAEGLECYRIQFPKGMDANEYALKLQPADKALGLVIRKAVWLGKGPAPKDTPGQHVEHSECIGHQPIERGTPHETADTIPPVPFLAAEPAPLESPPICAPLASPASAPAPAGVPASVSEEEVVFSFGERRWRVRGLAKNLGCETLKVNVLASRAEAYYVDTLDLYSARQRAFYLAQAAKELAVSEDLVKLDLGRVLLKLEDLQQARIRETLVPKSEIPAMSDEQRDAALALLRSPDLLERILADFEACGIVGEKTNKLVGYLAAVSRKLDAPLAVVIQSSSAAGKSSLMDAVLAMMPEEERVKYSAMTGQSLFYMGRTNLKHKVLAIVEEEGASRASYALKLLQSEGELTIASTGKDPTTGNLVTQEYRVEGPVMIFLTTIAIEIEEELLNRCLVLSVDEDREQTKEIHRLQRARRTLEGLLARQQRESILSRHRNAQRLLRPLAVVNPYAHQLTFLDDRTRTRRDHEKYLTLIDTIALLHQYQREVKSVSRGGALIEHVEVTLDDIATANQLAHEILGRSLDELPPQTRRLLLLLDQMVAERERAQSLPRAEIRLTRREVRSLTGIGDTQLRLHLERLTALEYLLVHRGSRGQSFVYELLYDGKGVDGQPFVPGLIDVERLRAAPTSATARGLDPRSAGPSRPQRGGIAGPAIGRSSCIHAGFRGIDQEEDQNARLARQRPGRRVRPGSFSRALALSWPWRAAAASVRPSASPAMPRSPVASAPT